MIHVRTLRTHDATAECACDVEDIVRRVNSGYTRNIWRWDGLHIAFSRPIAEHIKMCHAKWDRPVFVALDASKPGIDIMPFVETMRFNDELLNRSSSNIVKSQSSLCSATPSTPWSPRRDVRKAGAKCGMCVCVLPVGQSVQCCAHWLRRRRAVQVCAVRLCLGNSARYS